MDGSRPYGDNETDVHRRVPAQEPAQEAPVQPAGGRVRHRKHVPDEPVRQQPAAQVQDGEWMDELLSPTPGRCRDARI